MPRIPVRTEPYTSPARQQRHYKNKRDQMLRTLGKASYINGSHFAILLVSAKGEVETFASELLKPCLAGWFNGAVVEEARSMATRSRSLQQAHHAQQVAQQQQDADMTLVNGVPLLSLPHGDDDDDCALDDLPQSPSPTRSASPFPTIGPADSLLLRPGMPTQRSQSMRSLPSLPQLDTSVANNLYKYRSSSASYGPPSATSTHSAVSFHNLPPPEQHQQAPQPTATQPLLIPMGQLDAWYTDKLHALQQTTCKLVAKCWIKVIEPKKQTKHPYNLGEEGKPIWWPKGLQHREPDHLLKPERTQLLLSILRSPLILVSRLELSTAEQNHLIPPERIAILREIYKVAREDEKRRRGELPADQDIVVQVPAPVIPPSSRQAWHTSYADADDGADYARKRPRLSDQENDWRPVAPLHEQINGVPSPAMVDSPMSGLGCLGQPLELSGHAQQHQQQYMYAPHNAWSAPSIQLPGNEGMYYDAARPLTASTIDSVPPSRPMTAMTAASSLSDAEEQVARTQYAAAHLGVQHLIQRSHSFPGPQQPQQYQSQHVNLSYHGALQYPSQNYPQSFGGASVQPNPFGFVDSDPPSHAGTPNPFSFSMPPDGSYMHSDAGLNHDSPSDSWSPRSDEQHLGGTTDGGKATDSPSIGMLQWLSDSVHTHGEANGEAFVGSGEVRA